MKKIVCALFILGFILASCEKDDICDPSTPTTPRMVIKFFLMSNPTVPIQIPNLKIVGDGMDYNDAVLNNQGGQIWNDSLAFVPLRVLEDSSRFSFIRTQGDTIRSNDITDVLDFNYTRRSTYISRACGFKSTFDLFGNPNSDPFVLNDDEDATAGNWIKNIEVQQPNINDEDETHVNIYF